MIQIKLQFQAVLEQVFPEYKGVFGDLYSVVSLLTLLEFPSSEDILKAGEEAITDKISDIVRVDLLNGQMKRAPKLKLRQHVTLLKRQFIRVIF